MSSTHPIKLIVARAVGSILFVSDNYNAYIPRQNEVIAYKSKSYKVVDVRYIWEESNKFLEEVHVIVNYFDFIP